MTLENFARKMCYDYFQAYDVTLICLLFVRILYSNYILYNNLKMYNKCTTSLCKKILFYNII